MKRFTLLTFLVCLFAFPSALFSQQDIPASPKRITTGKLIGISKPLRDLPAMSNEEYNLMVEKAKKKAKNTPWPKPEYPFASTALPKGPDPVWQKSSEAKSGGSRAPLLTFEGQSSPYYPPDCNGATGPNHYMQTVNTTYAIYNKSGALVKGPLAMNTLFGSVLGATQNDGDPIILYDEQANRWLAVEFSVNGPGTDYMLIAVSTTNDPTGTWWQYSFDVVDMPDYEKMAVWRDGYYMGTNTQPTTGSDIYVFERSQMLIGGTARMVQFDNPYRPGTGVVVVPPVDNDGPAAPVGTPGTFIAFNDDGVGGGADELWLYELAVNWTTPASSTFNRTQQISVASFDTQFNDWEDIDQPGTTRNLCAISTVIMNVPQYRNFGTYQSIVCCHTVDVDGTNHAGVRWYELRKTPPATTWTLRQQGTYAPDAHSRWMGAIAMNSSGKIAVGYSISSATVYPGIRYTGQSSAGYSSASGLLDVPEETVLSGTNYQYTYNRWGDYASMSVDPTDDQTFWFTTEYIGASEARNTKIVSFIIGNAPIVTTLAATAVTGTSATINGTVNPNTLATNYHFEWGTTTGYGNNTSTVSAGSGSTAISVNASLSGLISGTTYHFRLVAVNADGTGNGSDLTFIPGGAVMTTTAATVITLTSATSGGVITSDGGSAITVRGVCWGITTDPVVGSGNYTTNGSGTGSFTSSITGLSASTTYHVRAYATNGTGTFYGNDITFTTLCGIYTLPFSEGFSGTTIPTCWSQIDHQGNGQIWTFGVLSSQSPLPALTGNYAYLNSDGYGIGNTQNADLITPTLNLSSYSPVTLQFNHYFKSYSGSIGTLSYSIDNGTTWTQITSLATSTNPAAFSQNIPGVAGQANVKFKWNYTGTYGYSWAIDDIQITGTLIGPSLSVTPADRPVSALGGTTTFSVASTSAWTVTSNQSWCTITPSGTGNGTITATYAQNNTGASRVANITVTVTGLTPIVVTVTQAIPTLSVTPADQPVTYPSGSTTFTVTSNSSWTVASNQIWCTVTPSGTGSGSITATYSANPTVIQRIANVTVTVPGLTPVVVTVTQAAGLPTLSVTPSIQLVTAASGNTSFAVSANTNWTATSNQLWCTVTPSGSGNGTILATYTQNPTASSRVASVTVTVTGLTPIVVTVTQAAPTLSVTPADQAVPYTSGNTSFAVASNSGWAVISNQTWCTVTPSGTGDGTISASYALNTSSTPRIASITVTVSGLTPVVVTVTQAGSLTPEFNYTIVNDVQTSDRTLEFDLYLLDNQPSTPFELSIIQAGILVNSGIISGGSITAAIVPGSSDLVALQQPSSITWASGTPNGCIKLAAKTAPGCGSGTIISTIGLGTRICRIRITNTVPFTASSQANLAFNFTTSPYPTKVFQYYGTPCTSNQLATNSTNTFSLAANPVLNGPPSLSVTPSDQPVTASAGTIPFGVTSNASWTATSNQTWCTVTPSGFGSGTITANYSENTDSSPRVASVTVTVTGLTPVVVTVTQAGAPIRTFNLTVFIEGLYTGLSTMHPAMDETSFHWGETIADKLTIELHSGANYSNIVYTATNVSLNTNGTATFTLPSSYNGNYYVTIKQRNHILTASAFPVSFSTSTINYNFDIPGKAYGDNMLLMIDGKYVFYAGDVNQDGLIDGSDLSDIGNLNDIFAVGYLSEDVNGDGLIDGSDLSITGNNNDLFIGAITP